MSTCERAVWEDAEGVFALQPPPKASYVIQTFQEFREPLDAYCQGAIRDHVKCTVSQRTRPPDHLHKTPWTEYYTTISGVENVSKEIVLTQECRRHPQKIEQFKTIVARLGKSRDAP